MRMSGLRELLDKRAASPEMEARRREMRRLILDAIDELPPEQKEVFLLNEVQGVTFRKISARTGVPISTLLARKRYAVLKLRKALSGLLETPEEETR